MSVFISILFFLSFQALANPESSDVYLQKGYLLIERGDPQAALQLWEEATNKLDLPSFMIATEYLRTVTEHKLEDYYPTACRVYEWGLSDSDGLNLHANRDELEQELFRMSPILSDSELDELQKLLDGSDAELLIKLKRFWAELDPTPDTDYNERMIEHWLRIAYSKEHFTLKNEPPYGTDVRGLYYVKYGETDQTDKGRVRITYDSIQTVLNQLLPAPDANPFTAGGNNFDLMKVSNRIQNLFVNPKYEIWIYNTPGGDMTENMVLIFGHRSGGSFARLETLEDFIPESAFNLRVQSQVDPGLPPVPAGMVLQWLYYEYFAKKDPYFARLFSEYYSTMQRYIGISQGAPPDPFSMQLTKNQNILSAYQAMTRAPEKISTEEKKIPLIPIDIYQYRLLDESNRTVFVTFLESHPLQAFLNDYTANEELISQSKGSQMMNEENNVWYDLIHGTQLRDKNWDILAESEQSPRLIFYADEPFISSVFEIPWAGEEINQIFYAKLINTHPDSKSRVESIFSDSLRGLGKLQIEQPEPLEVEAGKMVMSDLILGYHKTDQADNQSFFNFVAANDRRIPEGENLNIHFELYELQADSSGMSHFEVAYEITPKSGFFAWTKRKRDEFNITLEFDNFGDRFAESLEIEAEGLGPDEYTLTWTVRDLESGKIEEHVIDFKVFELIDAELSTSSKN